MKKFKYALFIGKDKIDEIGPLKAQSGPKAKATYQEYHFPVAREVNGDLPIMAGKEVEIDLSVGRDMGKEERWFRIDLYGMRTSMREQLDCSFPCEWPSNGDSLPGVHQVICHMPEEDIEIEIEVIPMSSEEAFEKLKKHGDFWLDREIKPEAQIPGFDDFAQNFAKFNR